MYKNYFASRIVNFLGFTGRSVLLFLAEIGRFFIFAYDIIKSLFSPPYYFQQFWQQFIQIAFFSLPVVGLTAIFTGMVLALQSYTGFSRFSAENAIPTVVILSITRELGPVLAGLMVAGRVGAAIAAEIGTMKVSEQLDAMRTLSVSPYRYLFLPRVLSGLIGLPLLVIVADVIGVFGGYLVSIYKLGFNESNYISQTLKFLEFEDVQSGLIKASVFGFIITLMGCYQGFYCSRGAQGVGRATTLSVVIGSILILISNYFLTAILFSKRSLS